jgi:DNA-binding NarL/FixJ family response regulator
MLTSSREESDVVRSYALGVNAFVVKLVGFREFFDAIQDLGVFWAILNEPPPRASAASSRFPSKRLRPTWKKRARNATHRDLTRRTHGQR